jgi:hypothetical protein
MDWKGLVLGCGAAAFLAGPLAAPAAACPCPKQKMIEMYGTVSAYGPKVGQVTKPHETPPALTAADLVDARGPVVPKGWARLSTPASDQVTASFQQVLAADPY